MDEAVRSRHMGINRVHEKNPARLCRYAWAADRICIWRI
jgi:hypothetical protein